MPLTDGSVDLVSMNFIDLQSQRDRLRKRLDERIAAVLDHCRFILGPEVTELEEQLAQYVGVKHAISVASGTDALQIALMALEIGPGDEVITVPYTWISTAEAVALVGAKPVFVDVREDTFNLDPAKLEAAITPSTKAIMPVSIYGQCADLVAINAIAEKHGLPVIEDAAQSLGATQNGRQSGGMSTIGTTSFYPSKPLGGYGEGGAVFTEDDALADRMKQIRVHGQDGPVHPVVGLNGRLDTLQAAILLVKMEVFDEEIQMRQQVASRYAKLLTDLEEKGNLRLPVIAEGNTSVWAQYTVLVQEREAVQAALKERGVPSVAYYTTNLHLQPCFADLGYERGDFPVSESLAQQCLSLPMNPYLSREDQDLIVEGLHAVFS